jgi:hypothetical protein
MQLPMEAAVAVPAAIAQMQQAKQAEAQLVQKLH